MCPDSDPLAWIQARVHGWLRQCAIFLTVGLCNPPSELHCLKYSLIVFALPMHVSLLISMQEAGRRPRLPIDGPDSDKTLNVQLELPVSKTLLVIRKKDTRTSPSEPVNTIRPETRRALPPQARSSCRGASPLPPPRSVLPELLPALLPALCRLSARNSRLSASAGFPALSQDGTLG